MSASASATVRFTTRHSASASGGEPTLVSTSTAPLRVRHHEPMHRPPLPGTHRQTRQMQPLNLQHLNRLPRVTPPPLPGRGPLLGHRASDGSANRNQDLDPATNPLPPRERRARLRVSPSARPAHQPSRVSASSQHSLKHHKSHPSRSRATRPATRPHHRLTPASTHRHHLRRRPPPPPTHPWPAPTATTSDSQATPTTDSSLASTHRHHLRQQATPTTDSSPGQHPPPPPPTPPTTPTTDLPLART